MSQANVIVSYAPARPLAAREAERGRSGRERKGWGATLAGVALAGGAVFALGQFVRPDGTVRDNENPLKPRPALAGALPVRPPVASPTAEQQREPAAATPLPYLALVRDAGPAPTPARTGPVRVAPAPSPRPVAASPRVMLDADVEPPADAKPDATATPELATPSPAAPVPGQRRDLAGFLNDQGLTLAPPEPADAAEATVAPVAEWTPADLAATAENVPASVSASSAALAATQQPPSAATTTDSSVIALDTQPDLVPPAPIDRAASPVAPAPAADSARLAELAPVRAEQTSADLGQATIPELIEAPAASAPPFAIAVTPPPIAAGISTAPIADYIQSYPLAVVNGEPVGAITLRDLGAQGQAVHLGALVGLLKLRMPETEFARLSAAAAADQFVTLDRLRAAGITVQFDSSSGRLLIDAR